MMSDFDYALDMENFMDGFGNGEYGWQNGPPPPPPPQSTQWNNNVPPRPPGQYHPRRSNSGYMNAQYSEAYGHYRGGYGRGGGFGAPPPRFQPYPPGRPRAYGFGPVGQPPKNRPSPVHRAALLLEKCEVERQYIKLIPHHILDMIDSEHCGICGMGFDTLHLTKVHYQSKNHVKALKKLMGHHKNAKNIREYPIKARSLFCELCDVHITSTAHADSHYSGKSHRSIVEGRKPPKNPILLQGMEARIEQLIRREKKHLKISPELDSSEEKQPPNNKTMPPELICKICKIIVSCSDQMTSHLNGKKHLTKEKGYILKMMKGSAEQTNDDKSDGEKAEAVVVQEDKSGGEIAEDVVASEDKSGGEKVEDVVASEDKSGGEKVEDVVASEGEGEDQQEDKPVEDTDDDWGDGDGADWETYAPSE